MPHINSDVRKTTKQLIDMINGGTLDAMSVVRACLNHMSSAEVDDMAFSNGFIEDEEEDNDFLDDDDDDGDGEGEDEDDYYEDEDFEDDEL